MELVDESLLEQAVPHGPTAEGQDVAGVAARSSASRSATSARRTTVVVLCHGVVDRRYVAVGDHDLRKAVVDAAQQPVVVAEGRVVGVGGRIAMPGQYRAEPLIRLPTEQRGARAPKVCVPVDASRAASRQPGAAKAAEPQMGGSGPSRRRSRRPDALPPKRPPKRDGLRGAGSNPGAARGAHGRLDIVWFDFRNSPTPEGEAPGGNDGGANAVYYTYSTDSGRTLEPSIRISDGPSTAGSGCGRTPRTSTPTSAWRPATMPRTSPGRELATATGSSGPRTSIRVGQGHRPDRRRGGRLRPARRPPCRHGSAPGYGPGHAPRPRREPAEDANHRLLSPTVGPPAGRWCATPRPAPATAGTGARGRGRRPWRPHRRPTPPA